LIGTDGSDIAEINIQNHAVSKVMEGHYKGEAWGLAVHPTEQVFASSGDDGMIKVWDASSRKPFVDSKTRAKYTVNVGSKARAIAYSPDGAHLAVGLYSGHVHAYTHDLAKKLRITKCGTDWIQDMKYSPNGSMLAVSSHNNSIYLLNAPSYEMKCVCKGHTSYITHLDFSKDSQHLQSTCGAYELLFWSTKDGKQIKSAMSLKVFPLSLPAFFPSFLPAFLPSFFPSFLPPPSSLPFFTFLPSCISGC
jgi:WD40 repeat protein